MPRCSLTTGGTRVMALAPRTLVDPRGQKPY